MKEVFTALLEQLRAGNDALLATLVAQTGNTAPEETAEPQSEE